MGKYTGWERVISKLSIDKQLENAKIIGTYLKLHASYLSTELICGILGNCLTESGCDPHTHGPASDPGEGICAWTYEPTKINIHKVFNNYSYIYTWSLEQQMELLAKSLTSWWFWGIGENNQYLKDFKKTTTVDDAAIYFYVYYEMGVLKSRSISDFLNYGRKGTPLEGHSKSFWHGGDINNFQKEYDENGAKIEAKARCANARLCAEYLNLEVLTSGDYDLMLRQLDLKTLSQLSEYAGYTNELLKNSGNALYNKYTYPVHADYLSFSQSYEDLFKLTNSTNNTLNIALFTSEGNKNRINESGIQGRIYSVNDPTIVLDELALPVSYKDDKYVSRNIANDLRAQAQASYDRTSISDYEGGKKPEKKPENPSTNN